MPTTRLLIVRHGETLANREFRYIGSRDDPLSEIGQTQAAQLAQAHLDQTIVLVSHVGPIKALLCTALGVMLSSSPRFFLYPATISVVDWRDRDHAIVRLVNSHAHLGWGDQRDDDAH